MKYVSKYILIFSCLFLILFDNAEHAWSLTEKAQDLYKSVSPSVYQIRIIDLSSGEKSAIGSGFRFSKDGLFATNYHVISDVADKPDQYRIEYHKDGAKKGDMTLLALDITHDLAILKGNDTGSSYLSFRKTPLSKGNHIFPMGNPLDLGMTIVEGTYNGLIGTSPYEQILLSASLNGGMSGGPALDATGRVVGINVSIEGNDLSYLVPVKYLSALADKTTWEQPSQGWQEIIQDQILKKFNHVIHNILKEKWTFEKFDSLNIPQNISSSDIKCWGSSKKEDIEEDQFFSYGQKWCNSQNNIYLLSGLRTGTIGYSFMWIKSESLNALEFSRKYSKEYSDSYFYPSATEKEVTNFNCQGNFIKLTHHDWKSTYCVRQYKKYPKLHDVFLVLAKLDKPKQGHIIRIGLAGINKPLATHFLQKFLGGIK